MSNDTIPLSQLGKDTTVVAEDSPLDMQTVDGGRRIHIADDINLSDVFEIPTKKRTDWSRKGEIGFFESLDRAGAGSLVPFVNPERAWKTSTVMTAMNRLKNDKYDGNTLLKKSDEEVFNKFTESLAEEQTRGYSGGGKFASGVAALPAFMVEFYATGGIASAGKEVTQKTLTALLGNFAKNRAADIAIRTAGAAAGAVARTPFASFGRIGQMYGDRQINANLTFTDKGIEIASESAEAPFTSLMKAAGDSLIENFSEVTGGAISRTLSSGASHVFGKKLSVALTQVWTKLHPNESITKLFTKAGYSNFIGEMGEERLGDLLRAVTGVNDFGAGDGASVLDKVIASIPSGQEFLVEAGVLAVPGAAHLGWQAAVTKMRKEKEAVAANPYTEPVEGSVLNPIQLDKLVIKPPTEASVTAPTGGVVPIPEVESQLGDLGVDFVPKGESMMLTFDQKIKQVIGTDVTRDQVMSSIQDEKVKLKLNELDEQANTLHQSASYLEKRIKTLEKAGQNSTTAFQLLRETQRQFDLVDSQRGDILTSVKDQINLEKETISSTGEQMTDSALKQKIQGFKDGAKIGRQITQEEFQSTRKQLFDLVKQSELTSSEAGNLLTKAEVEAIKTPKQLEAKLPDLEVKIGTIVKTRHAKELKAKIESLLAGTKTKTEGGKPIGKYTPEIQVILDKARAISKMTREQARAQIDNNLALTGDELATDEMRLENALLETMAGLNKQDPDRLAVVLNELDALVSTGKAESFLRNLSRKERQIENLAEGLGVLTGGKPLDELSRETFWKKMQKKWRSLGSSMWANWDDILNQLSLADKSSKSGKSKLSDKFSVGKLAIAERASVSKLAQSMVEEGMRIFGFKSEFAFAKKMHSDLAEENSDIFTFSDGKQRRLSLSRAQMRKRWMELQDPNLVDSIMSPEGNAYTPEIVTWIEDHLSLDDMEFAQAQLAFYKEYYAKINEVYREQYGVDLPFNEFYSPIRRDVDTDILNNPLKQEAEEYAAFIPGSLKSRVVNLRPIKDMNDWEVIQRHIIQMEHFRHWANTIRDLNAFFSDGNVKQSIEKQFGSNMNNIIANFLRDFKSRGVRQAQSWEKWFDMYRTGKIVSELGMKPVQVLKQVTGMFAYAEFVTPAEFISGMKDFATNPKKIYQTLSQSEEVKLRWGNITQEFVGLMSSENAREFRNNPNFKNAIHLSMSAIRMGDQAGILLGGWSVYKAALAKTGSPEKAMDAFEKAILAVQPTSYVGGLTEWQRGNGFQKAFTLFTSSQHRYFMRELTAIRDSIAGRASPGDVAKVIVIHHFLIPGLFQLVADGFKWDDEEQLRAAITGPLNGAFILGDMLDSFVRTIMNQMEMDIDVFKKDAPYTEVFHGVEQALADLNIDDIDFESVLEAMKTLAVRAVGPTTGLPTKLIFDVWPAGVSDIMENDEAGLGAMKLLGWSPYQLDKVYDKE